MREPPADNAVLFMTAALAGMRRRSLEILIRDRPDDSPAKPRETAPAPPPAEEPPMSRQQRRARERAERKRSRPHG